ncbi:hypothetical protein GCM10008171_31630 [Methylopila jiangsuensis]|uniref:EF-hand domain-containing protein n=1 Tax=Methylopila jiangsuensis TaxID=586230 RepID=A0A9W6JKR8_9HYPH|nr:hypothetical protein [Methylopila jiangsuensis]MDR6284702.1 hypothetical protein [Methylopila jiangsuensis]GLK77909.1 hypothetical protein GCM10008171_31630 [Methylopila jiangsuensis]
MKTLSLLAGAALLFAVAPAMAQTIPSGADVLKTYNKDGDDTLELAEVIHLSAKLYNEINPDGDSTLEPDETKGRLTASDWKKANKDGDKTLEVDEWLSIARKRFAAADKNKDGKLTAAELDSKAGRGVVVLIAK